MKIFITSILLLHFVLATAWAQTEKVRERRQLRIKNKQNQEIGFYQESHALVIGVSDYTHGWSKLPGVKQDVAAVKHALEQNGFQVQMMMDPTTLEMDQAFDNFIKSYGGSIDNRLLFYYAGHGHSIKPKYGGEALGYLVPREAPNPDEDLAEFKRVSMSMQRIEEYALNIDAKHALFLFDSCFSGSMFSLSRAAPEYISYKTSQPVRQFITAGNADELVPDVSIFRGQFIAALEGEGDVNQDGYLTGSELGEFLQSKVVNYSKGAQHPQYGKLRNPNLDKGDFVFQVKSSKASPIVVPAPPKKKRFSLETEFEAAKTLESNQKQWEVFQEEMRQGFDSVALLEQKPILPPQKAAAWQKFLDFFTENNPYSVDDETMRQHALKQMAHWNQTEQQATLPVQAKPLDRWTEPITRMEFVALPGGDFQMGDVFQEGGPDEKQTRTVRLAPFWMATTEVSQGQWKKIMGDNPSHFNKGDFYPVERVGWDSAKVFIRKLNEKNAGHGTFRLPSEAEWEYACREGGQRVRFGNGEAMADPSQMNFNASAEHQNDYSISGKYRESTVLVDRFTPNAFGLYQMSGNVWEWVEDKYNPDYDTIGSNNPVYRGPSSNRVIRGGSWYSRPINLRCSNRRSNTPSLRYHYLGFRLAWDAPSE